MHQTKKGNQWYFGMKAHVGVDSRTKIIHAVVATAANVADSHVLPDLLHGEETRVWGDQAYRGQTEVIKAHAPDASDFTNKRDRHGDVIDEVERAKNRTKSKVRAKVEHAIGVIKRVFGFTKNALPRPRQERPPPVRHLCPGQPVRRPPPSLAPGGVVCPEFTTATAAHPETASLPDKRLVPIMPMNNLDPALACSDFP
jgi:hypothetical protein